MAVLEFRDVHKSFEARAVLRGVNWVVTSGAIWGLIGESGAGKTTLLRLAAGLDAPDGGEIVWSDESAGGRRTNRSVGMVFQDVGLWPHLSVRRHLECVAPREATRRVVVEELLAELGLPRESWDRTPETLSGGEAQRLGLARALATSPSLILLDEPFSQLEVATRLRLSELLRGLWERRRATAVLVTHSWLDTHRLCDRVAVLVEGQIAQAGPIAEVFRRPVSAAVARLSGPYCEIPLRLVREGRVTRVSEGAGEWRSAEDGERQCLIARPHQIRFTPGNDIGRWRVSECVPQAVGWTVMLEDGVERLEVVATTPVEIGGAVGVAVVTEVRV